MAPVGNHRSARADEVLDVAANGGLRIDTREAPSIHWFLCRGRERACAAHRTCRLRFMGLTTSGGGGDPALCVRGYG